MKTNQILKEIFDKIKKENPAQMQGFRICLGGGILQDIAKMGGT